MQPFDKPLALRDFTAPAFRRSGAGPAHAWV